MSDTPAAGDASLLRRLNTRATLHVLRRGGASTVSRLARATGLSRQTVETVLEDLGEAGWVTEVPRTEGGMGRPARRFRFRADAGYVLGLDVGVHKILAMLADLDGNVLAAERTTVPAALPAANRLSAARDLAAACVEGVGVPAGHLWAAAAGTPGIVDRGGRVTLCTVMPGWGGVDLATRLGRWFDCPGLADNDANAATLGEHWRGSAQHSDDVVYVLVGHRGGAGIMIGGSLHRGRTGGAGEVGLLRFLGWQDAPRELSSGGDAGEVFAAAARGEAAAVTAVERFAADIARGVAVLVLAVDPELVVVGGGFSQAGDVLLDPLRARLAELCLSAPQVTASTLGDESVALGAVRLALEHVEQVMFESAGPATGTRGRPR